MPAGILFRNARVFDGESPWLKERADVLVRGDVIEDISDTPLVAEEVEVVDCAGRVLMPGLIDAHVHVYAHSLNITRTVETPISYLAHFAAEFLRSSLDRGFTTLRDVGGGDIGVAAAIRDGLLGTVPRFYYGGRVISQTGGHGDFRPGDRALDNCRECGCHMDALAVIADGADAVRRAVREELRRGASHIKIMASGGVASPTDPLERCQYSEDEIRAAVEEAERAGSYVAAHCHPTEAVRRAADLGVRSIEHGTLIDRPTADRVAERGAFIVPTLATLAALSDDGEKLGLPRSSVEKLQRLGDHTLRGLEIMKAAGVKMGLGTDLLGTHHVRQSTEFALRGKVLPAIDILRSTCVINAELLGAVGRLGCIRKGAAADLLLVEGNPLEDISILAAGGERLVAIVRGGRFHKRPQKPNAQA